MKKTILACLLALSSSSVLAFNYQSGSNLTEWEIGGTIEPRCVVERNTAVVGTELDLSKAVYQDSAEIEMWCNTPHRKADVMIVSTKNGYMENANGRRIKYALEVGKHSELDLSKPGFTVVDLTTGRGGRDAKTKTFKIKPMVNGREFAGIYRDIITVSVHAR